jgi:hypothetical protein
MKRVSWKNKREVFPSEWEVRLWQALDFLRCRYEKGARLPGAPEDQHNWTVAALVELAEGLGAIDFRGWYYNYRGKRRKLDMKPEVSRIVEGQNRREALATEQGISYLWLARNLTMLEMVVEIRKWQRRIRSSE